MNKLTKFLLWLSVTDPDFIKECPRRELILQTIIGTLILLTSIFAAFAAGYAMHTVFNNWFFSIVLGLLWGIMINTFDRLLVSSFKVSSLSSSEDFILKKFFFPILFRLPFAVLIGFTVAVPIELAIFSSQINTYFESEERKALLANEDDRTDRFLLELEKKQKIIERNLRIDTIKSRINNLEVEQRKLRDELLGYQQNPVEGRRKVLDKDSNEVYQPIVYLPTSYYQAKEKYDQNTVKINKLNQDLQNRESMVELAMDSAQITISENLTTFFQPQGKPNDLVERIVALEEMTTLKANSIKFYIKWGIRLLIIFIEVVPMIIRIFADQTLYEDYIATYYRSESTRLSRVR